MDDTTTTTTNDNQWCVYLIMIRMLLQTIINEFNHSAKTTTPPKDNITMRSDSIGYNGTATCRRGKGV